MTAPTILLGPSTFAESDPAPVERLKAAGFEVAPNPFRRKLTKPELLELLGPDVVGLIAGLEPLDREVLGRSRLKALVRCGAGMSNVDLAAARELGIAVGSTPDAPADSVAELTVAALLGLLRQVPAMDAGLRAGRWDKRLGRLLKGMTVAVVGFGRIGRRVAGLLKPFGARLLAVDPGLSGTVDGVPVVPLGEALTRADVVSLHLSGEDLVLGKDGFSLLKRGAYVLNAARGGLVDEAELAKALSDGRVAGAWLDAFSAEPYAGPLASSPKTLLTPHVGSYTIECRRAMELEAAEKLLALLGGKEAA